MTLVIAYTSRNASFMTYDTGSFSGDAKSSMLNEKVIDVNNMLIGFSGSLRIAQLVKHELKFHRNTGRKVEHITSCADPEEFIGKVFIPNLRNLLKEYDLHMPTDDDDKQWDMLVIARKTIFQIQMDFSYVKYARFAAIGAPADEAFTCLQLFDDLSDRVVPTLDPVDEVNLIFQTLEKTNHNVMLPCKTVVCNSKPQ